MSLNEMCLFKKNDNRSWSDNYRVRSEILIFTSTYVDFDCKTFQLLFEFSISFNTENIEHLESVKMPSIVLLEL